MKCSLVFCCIFIIIQLDNVYSQYTVDHEVANSIHSTFEMYRKVYDENKNFVFSPLSFRIIYSILYQPSKNSSETALKNLLFSKTKTVAQKTDLITGQTQNIDDLAKSSNIRLANKIYLSNDEELKHDFSTLVQQYRAGIEQVDFKNEAAATIANRMNHWVEDQTNGLIKNLVEDSAVTPDVQLFLINTVYFKADWLQTFTKYNVQSKPFNSIDGTRKSIDSISELDDYNLSINNESNVDVLELPYTHGSGFAFWIILPRSNLSLKQLTNNLNVDFVTKIKETLQYKYAHIQFPIFEIESAIDGKQITPEIFDKDDFDIVEGTLSAVDAIKQKAKIIVNTKGTEAAAATYAKITPLSLPSPRPEPTSFIADRPFIYAVVSDSTKEPIFIGHYSKA